MRWRHIPASRAFAADILSERPRSHVLAFGIIDISPGRKSLLFRESLRHYALKLTVPASNRVLNCMARVGLGAQTLDSICSRFILDIIVKLCNRVMQMIPPFEPDGLLPPGDFEVSFDELRRSPLVLGPGNVPSWDASWRSSLVDNLEILTRQLWQVGIREVFADGSFAEDKSHPNDIDGYFVCDLRHLASGDLARQLNLLDPHKVWTWNPASRRPYRGYPKRQLPMWHRYRVELYPHIPNLGIGVGIFDKHGNELEFPAAFRQSRRDGKPRGILKIKYEGNL